MASPLSAAGAYANIARLADPAAALGGAGRGRGRRATPASPPCSRRRSARSARSAQKSDAQTRAAANGKANMVDVVTAVSETEVAIDAVVAVRDKVIAAYEDIMKMPI